jgi:hypothetical protein
VPSVCLTWGWAKFKKKTIIAHDLLRHHVV